MKKKATKKKESKKFYLVASTSGATIKNISDISTLDISSSSLHANRKDAIDSDFSFEDGNYLLEVQVIKIETDKVVEEKLQALNLK